MHEFLKLILGFVSAGVSWWMLSTAFSVEKNDHQWKAFFYIMAAMNFVWFLKFVW